MPSLIDNNDLHQISGTSSESEYGEEVNDASDLSTCHHAVQPQAVPILPKQQVPDLSAHALEAMADAIVNMGNSCKALPHFDSSLAAWGKVSAPQSSGQYILKSHAATAVHADEIIARPNNDAAALKSAFKFRSAQQGIQQSVHGMAVAAFCDQDQSYVSTARATMTRPFALWPLHLNHDWSTLPFSAKSHAVWLAPQQHPVDCQVWTMHHSQGTDQPANTSQPGKSTPGNSDTPQVEQTASQTHSSPGNPAVGMTAFIRLMSHVQHA